MNRSLLERLFVAGFLVFLSGLTVSGQVTGGPVRVEPESRSFQYDRLQSLRLASTLMGREMGYRVVLPSAYNTAGTSERFAVIYLLHGLTGNYSNWTDRTKLGDYAAAGKFIIVTPEGENGWYTDNPTKPNHKYESYIIKELIPQVDKQFRTIPERKGRMIAGLSMGGYGAVKFGLKYPEMFSLVGSFSGALAASSYRTAEEVPASIRQALVGIFGEPNSETHKSNDIFRMISDSTSERIRAAPFIYLSCGTEDFLVQHNREFLKLLNDKKIPHEYRELPGAHNWAFWDDQVREFLALAARKQN